MVYGSGATAMLTVAAGGFLALRPRAREQARAALTTQTAQAERRKVMLARLQRSGERWRGRRQAHQQLVDAAHDLLLAAGDLGCARIRPPVETAGSALLEKHLDHRHGLLLAQEEREPPPALVAQQPAARFGHDAQIAQCRLAFALAVLRLPLGEEDHVQPASEPLRQGRERPQLVLAGVLVAHDGEERRPIGERRLQHLPERLAPPPGGKPRDHGVHGVRITHA